MTSMTVRSNHRPILILFCVALSVRIIMLVFFNDTSIDNGRMVPLYDLAANWVDCGHFYSDDEFVEKAGLYNYYHTPPRNTDYYKLRKTIHTPRVYNKNPEITDTWGYAVLLGLIWKITPLKSYLFIQIPQIIFDSCAAVLLFLTLARLFGNTRPVFFAALLYAVFIPFALFSMIPNREYYAAWGAIFGFYFFTTGYFSAKRSLLYYTLAGSSMAFFCWFRPTLFLMPCIFVGWIFLISKKNRIVSAMKVLPPLCLPVILIFVLPFGIQFSQRYGTIDFLSGIAGHWLWTGLGNDSGNHRFKYNDLEAYKRAVELGYQENKAWYTTDYGNLLKNDALSAIDQNPFWYAKIVAKRYVRYFFARPPFPLSEWQKVSYKETGLPLKTLIFRHPFIFFEKAVKIAVAFLFPLLAVSALFFFPGKRRYVLLLLGIWQYRLLFFVFMCLDDRFLMETYFSAVLLAGLAWAGLFNRVFFFHSRPFKSKTIDTQR